MTMTICVLSGFLICVIVATQQSLSREITLQNFFNLGSYLLVQCDFSFFFLGASSGEYLSRGKPDYHLSVRHRPVKGLSF